jgi:bacillithiol biosynthesis cysteine-adding enzyme BshC
VSATPPLIDYARFQPPPSPLFRDHLSGEARAAGFFGGGWGLPDLERAALQTRGLPRDHAALARALAAQQEQRGAAAAGQRALELQREDAAAVVTGQQAGLFGGPLYVLHKALGAVELAARLEARLGSPVVPVFWVASDDHDFAEVRSVSVLDHAGAIRTLRYEPRQEPAGEPASRIVLDETMPGLVDELAAALSATPYRDEVVERVRSAYVPGTTLAGAFARLLSSWLPGLVVLDPADPALKRLMSPVLDRELREGSPTTRLAQQAGAALLAAGYHQQVPVRPGFLNLFLLEGERRHALGLLEGGIEVRGGSGRMPIEEALALLAEHPELWSPGVLLRPLAQDLMLPTAAYVGGPGEVAYHAQIGPSYAHFGVPRPVLVPRPGLTVVEPAQARALEAEGMALPDLQSDPEVLLARWAREAYPEVESSFARVRESLAREMGAVTELLGGLDPTLRAAAEGALGRALHPVETLHEKSVRALKKRDETRATRLRRTRDALMPGGALQERGMGLVWLLARHGEPLLHELRARLDPFARGHQVVNL